ncbi:unnamed protein product [Pedinophyceae sp. YPF-701]|nr:unnamed protein product [Pedinophyceae sp. YPF-701]
MEDRKWVFEHYEWPEGGPPTGRSPRKYLQRKQRAPEILAWTQKKLMYKQLFEANPMMPRTAGKIIWEKRLLELHEKKGKFAPKKGEGSSGKKGKKR